MTTPITWADAQNSIKAAVQGTGATVAGAVTWADEQQPAAEKRLILDIVYAQTLQDRDDFEVGVDGISTTWTHSTLYYIRVQIRAETHLNGPGKDALFFLEKCRAMLLRPALVLNSGVVMQPDSTTYIHHVPYVSGGRTVSAYAFEMGFRAVIDSPLSGTIDAEPNMVQVDVDATAPQVDQIVDRP